MRDVLIVEIGHAAGLEYAINAGDLGKEPAGFPQLGGAPGKRLKQAGEFREMLQHMPHDQQIRRECGNIFERFEEPGIKFNPMAGFGAGIGIKADKTSSPAVFGQSPDEMAFSAPYFDHVRLIGQHAVELPPHLSQMALPDSAVIEHQIRILLIGNGTVFKRPVVDMGAGGTLNKIQRQLLHTLRFAFGPRPAKGCQGLHPTREE